MHSSRSHNNSPNTSRLEIPPGTLGMLILRTLKAGPLHGYAIARQIEESSGEALRVEEGSLYPALQRLLRQGWVTAEWVEAGPKRRARVYQLTPAGRRQLQAEVSQFRDAMAAILRVIEPA
jgi:transcriptional regulator